ncbi:agamous-like MADS-box protein AGL80 [Cornus florida]|uniref:agamous-like MADS-box protein AGL80 n=1 Tax=Cornus florida TaxID=4283 RepID=UPI00289B29E6|nr:agamous-like MADS-box protein AGL80 [Cornus florida]
MTRKKVKLQYIVNETARKATFKKRKKGLMKKVNELSTLCGIEACAIIFSEYDSEPEVWPSPLGVQRVLSRFARMPEMEQNKKMMSQESYIRHRIAKAEDQLRKLQKENRHKEMTYVMYRFLAGDAPRNLSMVDLNDVGWLLDQNIKDIQAKIEAVKREQNASHGRTAVVNEATTRTSRDDDQSGVAEGMSVAAAADWSMMTPVQDYQWYMDLLRPDVHSGVDETLLPIAPNNTCLGPNYSMFP